MPDKRGTITKNFAQQRPENTSLPDKREASGIAFLSGGEILPADASGWATARSPEHVSSAEGARRESVFSAQYEQENGRGERNSFAGWRNFSREMSGFLAGKANCPDSRQHFFFAIPQNTSLPDKREAITKNFAQQRSENMSLPDKRGASGIAFLSGGEILPGRRGQFAGIFALEASGQAELVRHLPQKTELARASLNRIQAFRQS